MYGGNSSANMSCNIFKSSHVDIFSHTLFCILQIVYTVLYTAGVIDSVSAEITTETFNDTQTALQQRFKVKYLPSNQQTDSYDRSGNPGYLVGKPVRAGNRIVADSGDFINLRELTVVASTATGDCSTDATNRIPILFGENIRTGCMLRLSSADTRRCDIIFQQAVDALLGPTRSLDTDGSVYLASYGNTAVSKIGDWVPVIVGSYTTGCTGLSMQLEILYAQSGSLANPQSRIIGAKLSFEEVSLEFSCLSNDCQPSAQAVQNFEVKTSVTFVDASDSPTASLAEKPRFRARLPQNFFHPFYSNACMNTVSLSGIVVVSLVRYLL